MTPPADPPTNAAGADSPGAADLDERLLVERCRAGDVEAFEPLVAKYRQRVWRLAFQVLRDREEAWDCAQDAFVRAFQSLASFRGQSAFYSWLFRIAMNVATDRLRARSAQTRAFGKQLVPAEEWERTAPDHGERPDQAAVGAERRLRISQALDSLPPNARTIIMLSDVEGLSYREIAAVLNCPIGTVMSRLHNARKRLRSALGPMLVALACLAAVLGGAGWVSAQAPTPAPAQSPAVAKCVVHFEVRVLQASKPAPPGKQSQAPSGATVGGVADGQMDERLKQIVPRLRKLFQYSDYVPLDHHKVDVECGSAKRLAVAGERWLEVTPQQLQGKSVRMQVRLVKGDKETMQAIVVAGPGAPYVVGGPRHGPGELIIIIWADPIAAPAAK